MIYFYLLAIIVALQFLALWAMRVRLRRMQSLNDQFHADYQVRMLSGARR